MGRAPSVVTFDGDETLWDFQGAMRRALEGAAEAFDAAGFTRADGPVTARWLAEVRETTAARPELRLARMEDIRLTAFEESARQTGAGPEFARTVFGAYMEARHAGVRLYADSSPCLEALAAMGLRLGLITNGNSRPDLLGLGDLLAVTVVAADCGHRKPDPAIYRCAAARLGVAPEDCVHVGDHITEDVDASAAAGMRAVWLVRGGLASPAPHAEAAWRTVRTLPELPALLSEAAGSAP
ncbi:HAD family hydrolase [Planotetraspora sp. GP83]|uniref:HAD family hydrolase n=1 Tax=Planotetraspora sp. GP83 TaxID=3156264 RepID=UPI00351140D4